jgi:hypothetical protein
VARPTDSTSLTTLTTSSLFFLSLPLPSYLPPPPSPSATPPPQVNALIDNAGSASTDVLAELKKTIQLKEALLIDAIVSSPRIVN